MNPPILSKPSQPIVLKLTAQGYMKTISMSNKTKSIATKKYLIGNGDRALPIGSSPHSKFAFFLAFFRFGPNMFDASTVAKTNRNENAICINIGIKSYKLEFMILILTYFILLLTKILFLFIKKEQNDSYILSILSIEMHENVEISYFVQ